MEAEKLGEMLVEGDALIERDGELLSGMMTFENEADMEDEGLSDIEEDGTSSSERLGDLEDGRRSRLRNEKRTAKASAKLSWWVTQLRLREDVLEIWRQIAEAESVVLTGRRE